MVTINTLVENATPLLVQKHKNLVIKFVCLL